MLTDISVDKKNWVVSGNIENKGNTAIKAASIFFEIVDSEYRPLNTIQLRMLNNIDVLTTGYGALQEVKPGQRLSFESASIEMEGLNQKYSERLKENLKTATLLAVKYE